MRLTEIAVARPVFTMVVYIAVTVFGLVALYLLPLDLYPEIENPVISIVTHYPGASSYDVEEKVTKPLEKSLAILPSVDEITSNSVEGISAIFLKFDYGSNLDEASNDIRVALDWAARALPDGLDDPMLFKFNTAFFPIYFLALTSDTLQIRNEGTYIDENIVQSLQSLPGVGSVQLFNVAAEQVQVRARLGELEKRGLTLGGVARALAAANVSVPAGSLEDPGFDLPVRVPAEYRTVAEIADEIVAQVDGKPVYLRDIATVHDTHEELSNVARLNDRPVSVLFVQKQSGANTVEVARAVKRRLAELRGQLTKDVRFVEIFDGSLFIENMIGNLYNALMVGGLLVVLVVLGFLRRLRASLIIAMSIPGSLIIAFLLMYLQGYTINAVSLMGMALAVGMVVDNSIVVLENVTRHLDAGHAPAEASIRGTRQVGLAISASTLTSIGIFAPMIFAVGLVSILFGQLAFVVVVTLLASLVTSLFLTPMLTARLLRPRAPDAAEPAERPAGRRAFARLEAAYGRLVERALRHRLAVYLTALLLLAGSGTTLVRVGFDFLPDFDTGDITVSIELPMGVSIARSAEAGRSIGGQVRAIPEVVRVFYQAGESESGFGAASGRTEATHIIDMRIKLTSIETGRRGVKEVAEDVRRVLEATPGLVAFDVTLGGGGPGQIFGRKPLEIELLGTDYERLKAAAYEVEERLERIEGTRNVAAEVPYEKPEVHLDLDRRRMALLGTTALQAAEVLRTAVDGSLVTRFRGGGKDVDVILTLEDTDKDSPEKLGRVLVPSLLGRPAPLRNFAAVSSGFSPIVISHSDLRRVLVVGANLYGRSLGEVAGEFDTAARELRRRYPDVAFRFSGQVEEQRENAFSLGVVLVLGIILTYLVMSAQFESFLDPFVIMFSVPFAFSGSFLLLSLSGQNFNVLAFLGIIMLVGIVVNNAIVLVDYVNRMRAEGEPLLAAVVETAKRRLRPILMTTITTLFGMLPLALASGEGFELWRPIGTTVVGGLLVSSLVTLVITPTLYVGFERFRRRWRTRDEP